MITSTFKIISRLSLFAALGWLSSLSADNQTPDTSSIYPENDLPFRIQIEQADFSLPNGLHSGVKATYKGKWLFLAGRTNGMHSFNFDNNNFPPSMQNQVVYVVDPVKKTVVSKSLTDPSSGLTQHQVDLLSVTSPQYYRTGQTLYITGGYGVDTSSGLFSTKDVLTAINVPGLIHWVLDAYPGETAAQHIRQISDPIFRVTGGYMTKIGHTTLLVFGQNFQGFYLPSSSGEYTEQIRRFKIYDNGKKLAVKILPSKPLIQEPNYRRRDLNVVPIVQVKCGFSVPALTALSGVFTLTGGIWTIPVIISANGNSTTKDANDPEAFKQGMNNYACATLGLFSRRHEEMYTLLLGGLSYGFFDNGVFETDEEIPFINQVTTIKLDKHGDFKQYIMSGQYPVIISTQSNPGNPLLFGAGAYMIQNPSLPAYRNGVLKLDGLCKEPVLLGYIVGGIQSTLPNTNVASDSAASSYIFKVTLVPVRPESESDSSAR